MRSTQPVLKTVERGSIRCRRTATTGLVLSGLASLTPRGRVQVRRLN